MFHNSDSNSIEQPPDSTLLITYTFMLINHNYLEAHKHINISQA